MQGVILAAGKGSRLHPITLDRSKAMLPILGKPIMLIHREGHVGGVMVDRRLSIRLSPDL